jgi:transcriptional regulator with XRE-family HTH domain
MGIVRSTYANYESGKREPDIDTMKVMADYYGVSISWLMGEENKKESENSPSSNQLLYVIRRIKEETGIDVSDDPDIINEVDQYMRYLVSRKK